MTLRTSFQLKFIIFTAFVCGLLFSASTASFGSEITFRNVFPMPNGCVLIYGGLSFGGKDFFIKECDSSWEIVKVFEIGYVKKIHFINDNTAWGIIGGSLVKLEYNKDDFTVSIVKRENDVFYLEDVFFINESNGWACGKNGLILKTIDSGDTWKEVKNDSNSSLKYIKFTDNNFGWSIGNDTFLTTNDSGETWEETILPDNKNFSDFYFTSNSQGCGIVSRDEVLCTNDGKYWNSVKLASENRGGIFFINNKKGWIVGTSILRTIDGGQTWTYSLQDKDTENRKYSGLNLDNVYFVNEKTGWAWGLSSVYKTTNEGISWEIRSNKWISSLKKITQ